MSKPESESWQESDVPFGRLGDGEKQVLKGKDYIGKFKGKGYLKSGEDDGYFLSNIPRSETTTFRQAFSGEKAIDMKDLLPSDWENRPIEYEITVKARIIKDSDIPQPPKPKILSREERAERMTYMMESLADIQGLMFMNSSEQDLENNSQD